MPSFGWNMKNAFGTQGLAGMRSPSTDPGSEQREEFLEAAGLERTCRAPVAFDYRARSRRGGGARSAGSGFLPFPALQKQFPVIDAISRFWCEASRVSMTV
jgi:hypothetical protein